MFKRTIRGFTIVELLVVIAIIAMIVALLLPAISAAREAARRMKCANNLRQIGIAMIHHHDTHRHFPTDGWGYRWVGDADRGFGKQQPGGWIFNTLPFLEERALHDTGKGMAAENKHVVAVRMLRTPLSIFHCPSRRSATLYSYTAQRHPLHNAHTPTTAAKSDYAVNAGDKKVSAGPGGPPSTRQKDLRKYDWPDLRDMTGVSFVRSSIRLRDVKDGATKTYMVGEKYVSRDDYANGNSGGDDQSMYIGDDADIRRWTTAAPMPDSSGATSADSSRVRQADLFGSAHAVGCYFVFCDGSVRPIAFNINAETHRQLGNRKDGEPMMDNDLF